MKNKILVAVFSVIATLLAIQLHRHFHPLPICGQIYSFDLKTGRKVPSVNLSSAEEQQLILQNRSGYDAKYGLALPNKEAALATADLYLRRFFDAKTLDAQRPFTVIDRSNYWLVEVDGRCSKNLTQLDCGDGGIALRKLDGGIIYADAHAI